MAVHLSKKNGIGEIILDRSKAYNALNYEMLHTIHRALDDWKEDREVTLVLIRSKNPKAFCAGADVKIFYENGIGNQEKSYELCRLEYDLNLKIYHYSKPYIAIMDGLVLGGGVGISLHGSHPIGTERMVFGLPEVWIGFFPDVGSTYFLPKLPYHVGVYMAMTGDTIGASDAYHLGLVKHMIGSKKIGEFLEHLPKDLEKGLEECKIDLGPPTLDFEKINAVFSRPFEEILKSWDFSGRCLKSVAIAYEQMQKRLSFDEAINYEKGIAKERLSCLDLYEGIYHRLYAKSPHPSW